MVGIPENVRLAMPWGAWVSEQGQQWKACPKVPVFAKRTWLSLWKGKNSLRFPFFNGRTVMIVWQTPVGIPKKTWKMMQGVKKEGNWHSLKDVKIQRTKVGMVSPLCFLSKAFRSAAYGFLQGCSKRWCEEWSQRFPQRDPFESQKASPRHAVEGPPHALCNLCRWFVPVLSFPSTSLNLHSRSTYRSYLLKRFFCERSEFLRKRRRIYIEAFLLVSKKGV